MRSNGFLFFIQEANKPKSNKPDLSKIYYIKAAHGPGEPEVYNSVLEWNGKKYRVRVEVLIYDKKNKAIMIKPSDKPTKGAYYGVNYRIPGGSTEPGKKLEDQAKAECKEEIRVNIKNCKYSNIWYTSKYDPNTIPEWQREHLWPIGLKYYGAIILVFTAEYNGRYSGKINDWDKDDMINGICWKSVDDVEWHPAHRKALKKIGIL